jgi:hypothetical protein
MAFNRRELLKVGGITAAAGGLPFVSRTAAQMNSAPAATPEGQRIT